MSLLKDGDGVNFQKASSTLDGCVKIYTSRVDSVADDTGKLLNGLAEGKNKKSRGADAEEGEDGDEEDGEEGEDGQKKRRKRTARSAEATLATSFQQLQNKKLDTELSVDPLFKKASADFDEGGAKGLLLNHLAIDTKGRIVFDSSDDAQDSSTQHRESSATPAPDEKGGEEVDAEEAPKEDVEIDISGLAAKYFPDLSILDEQDVCPSMKTFELGDVNGSLDLPFLDPPDDMDEKENDEEEEGNRSGMFLDEDNPMGFDDDDGGMAGFDLPPETGFGEGGEAWAREAAIEPQGRVHLGLADGDDDAREGTDGADDGAMGEPGQAEEQENILAYFDNALKKNWAGPEHWRIKRIKDVGKAPPPAKRKEKEPFVIDFLAPLSQPMADALYTPAASNAAISLPRAQWRSKTRNLLPDDKHFNSKNLLHLFLKPKVQIGWRRSGLTRRARAPQAGPRTGEPDEAYWANQQREGEADDENGVQGNYDADFFQDDGLGQMGNPFDDDDDDNFADARDHFSPPAEEIPGQTQALDGVLAGTQEGAFGTQLVAQNPRLQRDQIKFARVAKRVDVHRLKDRLWTKMGFEEVSCRHLSDRLLLTPL
jgi:condensin complex subunit 2